MPSVLITGANRGLGLELARQYAERGWRVLACCREPAAAATLRGLLPAGGRLSVHRLDLSDFASIDALATELFGLPIDVLWNNAGIYGDAQGTGFGALDYAAWKQSFQVNTLAPVKMAEAFMPHLLDGEQKRIVAMSSKMGSIGDNQRGGNLLYRSSKAALNAAMKSLAIDLAPQGVTVLILHPGWVRTDMGGAHASLLPATSVTGLIGVVERCSRQDSGRFLDYLGRELPW